MRIFDFPLFMVVAADLTQGPRNMAKPIGSNVSFFCNATSEPQHVITWTFNGNRIEFGPRYTIETTPTISTLTIAGIQAGDAGTYSCTVSNIHGNDSASAELEVLSKY